MKWLHHITSFAVSAGGDALMDCVANWMKVGHMTSHDLISSCDPSVTSH